MNYILCFLEKKVIARAIAIVFPSELRKKFIKRYYRISHDRLLVAENFPKRTTINHRAKNTQFKKIKALSKKFKILIYAGVLSSDRGIDYLIKHARKLDEEWTLVLVGSQTDLNISSMIPKKIKKKLHILQR